MNKLWSPPSRKIACTSQRSSKLPSKKRALSDHGHTWAARLGHQTSVEINKDQANEKTRVIYSGFAITRVVSHPHLHFGRDSKASRGVGKLCGGVKGGLQVCPDWRLLAGRNWSQTGSRSLCDWLELHIWLSLVGSNLEVGTKVRAAVIWSFGANYYRSYLASRIVTRDSNLTSCKPDF